MFGLTNTYIFFSSLYRNNKKKFVHAIASFCILIICLCSLQVRAQTDLEPSTKKPRSEQEYKAEMDRWMLTAFEGDPEAQYKVGILHTNTQFSQPDYEQAVYWYRQAARQGHVLAQYNLGHQYLLGVGVNKSESSAMKWWTEAAKQDHALAQFNIGRAYYLGIGLEQDHRKSKYWFQRAADNEEPKSVDILAKLGWAEGVIDKSVVADFDMAPSSDATAKSEPQIPSKPETQTLTKEVKTPNPSSQLAIKAARDRRATPDLRSKIIPIDLTKDALVDSKSNSDEPNHKKGNENSSEREIEDKPQEVSQETLAKISSLEPKNSPELQNGPDPKTSKLIITKTENKLGNLKPDEKLVKQTPLNKTVTGNLERDLPKKEQVVNPPTIDNTSPVAIYTNPQIRSVLIAIVDDRAELKIVKAGSEWSSVKSNIGIPVWMHGDYLKLDRAITGNDNGGNANVIASVTGNNVNTRSVPIVSSGTVVGRLNKGERLRVIEKRGEWYRVIAPKRFIAWVKTQTFNKNRSTVKPILTIAPSKRDPNRNDDQWLFEQKASDFTLQLGSFLEVAQIQEYLNRINFSQSLDLHQLVSKSDNLHRTVFLYGTYKSRKLAEKRRAVIDQPQAWVRTLGGLQKNRCKQWRQHKPTPEELQRYCKQ